MLFRTGIPDSYKFTYPGNNSYKFNSLSPYENINLSHSGYYQEQKKKGLTYQLIEAFVDQSRFRVIDLENLPIIIDEKTLCHYLGSPFLGLSSDCGIWIDTFLLGYIQEAEDSLTLSASMVDLETREILATKDVCEEIDPSELVWQEGAREHTLHICSILADEV